MLKILNLIAWFSSISLWIAIISFFGELHIIVWLLIWIILKYCFLSEEKIKNELEIFLKTQEKIPQKIEKIEENQNINNLEIKEKVEKIEQNEEKYFWEENILQDISQNEKIEKIKENIFIEKIKTFFKTNTIAKVWAILLLIWVSFLMMYLWDKIDNNIKMLLWFLIWFLVYFSWNYLEKKKFYSEAKILMWVWISINFLVILSWRYLFYGAENTAIIFTFLALIINTIFWILTALKYKSKELLIFSFIFAYLNPILLWTSSNEPYFLLIYIFFVTLSAIFISEKYESKSLFIFSFLAWNFYFLTANFWDEIWFLTKISFTILSSFIFINAKTSKNFEIEKWNLNTNLIIFLPIILQILTINFKITEFLYIILSAYSAIIFWFLFLKAKLKKETILLTLWNIFVIIIFWCLDFFNYWISIFSIFASIILAFVNIFSVFFIKNLKQKENLWNYYLNLFSTSGFLAFSSILFFGKYFTNFYFIWYFLTFIWIFYLFIGAFLTKIYSLNTFKNSEEKNIFITFFNIFIIFITLWFWFLSYNLQKINFSILYFSLFLFIESFFISIIYKFSDEKRFINISNFLEFFWFFSSLIYIFISYIFVISVDSLFFINILIFLLSIWKIYLLKGKIESINRFLHIFTIFFVFLFLGSYFRQKYNLWEEIIIGWLSTVFVTILWLFYKIIKDKVLKLIFLKIFVITCFLNIILDYNLYLSIFSILTLWSLNLYYFFKKDDDYILLNSVYWLYFFIISSKIIFYYTQNIYSLTFYWWIISVIFIINWIIFKKIFLRTIWLYILAFMCFKILFIDIFLIWDFLTGTIIFILLWIILILTSLFYTKYLWNDISKDLKLENIFKNLKENKKEDLINDILKTDINSFNTAILYIWEKEFLKTKRKSILQIIKYIVDKKWKNKFEKDELKDYFENVTKNYKSELDSKTRTEVEMIFKKFVSKWWKIEFE